MVICAVTPSYESKSNTASRASPWFSATFTVTVFVPWPAFGLSVIHSGSPEITQYTLDFTSKVTAPPSYVTPRLFASMIVLHSDYKTRQLAFYVQSIKILNKQLGVQ